MAKTSETGDVKAPKTAKKPAAKKEVSSSSWYQRHEKDTGSPEFQIMIIGEKINALQTHLASNKKDYDAQRRLLRLVALRRNHLKYLKNNNLERYLIVSAETGLKV
ncbi:MAG: 30S ribosomal protein S15 [Candidatus Absconditabacterales bacterium]|nr:30S ribosomal protein S15 [Candidatus Absconditabacterales bacterium]